MNNRLTYCGLVDARISASEKNLPVNVQFQIIPPIFVTRQTNQYCIYYDLDLFFQLSRFRFH